MKKQGVFDKRNAKRAKMESENGGRVYKRASGEEGLLSSYLYVRIQYILYKRNESIISIHITLYFKISYVVCPITNYYTFMQHISTQRCYSSLLGGVKYNISNYFGY